MPEQKKWRKKAERKEIENFKENPKFETMIKRFLVVEAYRRQG
jgi:hypothetical protein